MTFDSLAFLVFFVVVIGVYFRLPLRWSGAFLFGASYLFYGWWNPLYLLLLFGSSAIDYGLVVLMERSPRPPIRRLWLAVSLISNFGLLAVFKYAGFAAETLNDVLRAMGVGASVPRPDLLLPIGISFHTFQSMSYTIDAYRGTLRSERSFVRYLAFVSFFPQLVAGPIERANRLLPQFQHRADFDYVRVVDGCRRILWGLFKKVVIADRLATLADPVFSDPGHSRGWAIVLAVYAFSFQIYADFSAYTDIALGSARVLGFELMENFRQPYLSASPAEFWSRWHISLSTWFRDYLYIPLGGSRRGPVPWAFALLVTFVVSGLWHGARWTFVAWGAYHGLLTLGTTLLGRVFRRRLPGPIGILLTFHLVALGWILFRAGSMHDAGLLLCRLFAPATVAAPDLHPLSRDSLALGAILMLSLVLVDLRDRQVPCWTRSGGWSAAARWAAYAALLFAVLNLGPDREIPFIYFQF